ncbi:FAD-dependent oxidoreductase [Crossiella cryophila]|uniref:2-polyprenyl-6-methoxyphenol hydroxylase-like FAD-dependent oxidoreductase n=1 Tax=Crossiella cryophila TaxID=43355 RepID=A0A7W7CHC3_9PSEU|nr:pyridine nucleotide-disulfide oxidoreductase [Crossiella cryophila]MBB4679519.1 2-polyprenyl-6-methoxyphenol hydroxylase-like FAD-dependent oxidoreductase [Crossiella cryophila]
MPTSRLEHALVLGGGLAGTLAAFALLQHADTITVVDRDRLSGEQSRRKGAPHARHTHVLVSGGARAIDELVPGTTKTLLAAGAQLINLPGRYLTLAPDGGWFPRFPGTQYILGSSRDLLESTLRSRLREHQHVRFMDDTDVVGLTGDAAAVTGARLRTRSTGHLLDEAADLVIDTTGRGSDAVGWLTELGLPSVRESVVDPGIFYATRIFRAPDEAGPDFPALNVQSSPILTPEVRRGGTLIPIEDGLWTVTVAGATGDHPGIDDDGFAEFAASLPHPVLAELIAAAEPVGPAFGFRAHANRRRYFERQRAAPRGFVVLGDAYATFNPIYGHGMSVAALSAIALRDGLQHHGPEATAVIQRKIADTSNSAWTMATDQDLRYPQTVGPRPGLTTRLGYRLQDWLGTKGMHSRTVATAQLDVFTLSASPRQALRPRVLLDVLRSPRRPGLPAPPFTDDERHVLAPTPN